MSYEVTTIKEHWEIRFKDIDPDTGDITQDKPIAMTTKIEYATGIMEALSKTMEDPNREFYIRKIDEIKIKDIKNI